MTLPSQFNSWRDIRVRKQLWGRPDLRWNLTKIYMRGYGKKKKLQTSSRASAVSNQPYVLMKKPREKKPMAKAAIQTIKTTHGGRAMANPNKFFPPLQSTIFLGFWLPLSSSSYRLGENKEKIAGVITVQSVHVVISGLRRNQVSGAKAIESRWIYLNRELFSRKWVKIHCHCNGQWNVIFLSFYICDFREKMTVSFANYMPPCWLTCELSIRADWHMQAHQVSSSASIMLTCHAKQSFSLRIFHFYPNQTNAKLI